MLFWYVKKDITATLQEDAGTLETNQRWIFEKGQKTMQNVFLGGVWDMLISRQGYSGASLWAPSTTWGNSVRCGGCVLQGSGRKAMLLRVFTTQKYEGWLRAHAWPHQAYPWMDSTTYAMLGVIGWEDSGIPSNSYSYGSMTHHQHVGEAGKSIFWKSSEQNPVSGWLGRIIRKI